jgi:LysM repeat protein
MARNRLQISALLFALLATPSIGFAQGESRTHTVRNGDTLWDLAQQYLGDPFKWPEIYRRNQSTIQDPNLIYPDQVIIISGDVVATPGTPADTTVTTGGVGEAPVDTTSVEPGQGNMPAGPPPAMTIFNPDRYRVVRGERQSLRIQEPASAVRNGDYLQAPFMWDANGVQGAGRVVEGSSTDGIGIYNTERPVQYMEMLYIQIPQGAQGVKDERFLLFRYGPTIAGQGRVVVPTGIVKVTQAAGSSRTEAVLLAKFEDVFAGQYVMPLDTLAMTPGVFPSRVEFGLATSITYMYGEPVLPPVGHQIIFGAKAADGLVPGDQLTLQVPASTAADGSALPAQDIAVTQITRVTQWGASAIIIGQTDGGIKTGMAARVTGKMP